VNPAAARRGLDRIASWLLAVLALASLAIALAPEPPARALLAPADVVVDGGFVRDDPPRDFEVRRSVLESPAFATWRNWSATAGSLPGSASSRAFAMPAYLAIAYKGFAGEPGVGLWLECEATGRRLPVADARTNTQWSEVVLRRPRDWCSGGTLLRATGTRDDYVAFGTPFEVSGLAWLKSGWAGVFGIGVVFFLAVAGLVVACAAAGARRWPPGDPLAWGLLGLGLFCYACFFLFYAGRSYGFLASALALVAAIQGLRLLRAPSATLLAPAEAAIAAWRGPLRAWGLVALFYLLLLFAGDNGAGPWLANARFAPVRWSADNQFPMLIVEHLVRLKLAQVDLGPWLISDRTPLVYGMNAWLRAISLLFARNDDGPHLAWQFHALAGVIANSAWAPVCWVFLRRLQLRFAVAALALATLALLPFCLFNSIYTWPKLFGASFALLATWLLLAPGHIGDVDPSRRLRWLQAAGLCALALLSHGGTIFGILALLLLALSRRRAPLRVVTAAGALGVALLLPWMAWQRLVQPHGNALLKSVFAGTYGFDERNVGVLQTIARSYAAITPGQWLASKWQGLATLLLPPQADTCGMGEMVDGASGVGAARIADFLALGPSLKFLWLGLLVLLVPAWRRNAQGVAPAATMLLLAGMAGIAIELLTAWDCHIIHVQSYQSILCIALGLVLLSCAGPRALGICIAAATLLYGVAAWLLQPLLVSLRIDAFALAGLLALCAWLALRWLPSRELA
jgi:hypothetical protein